MVVFVFVSFFFVFVFELLSPYLIIRLFIAEVVIYAYVSRLSLPYNSDAISQALNRCISYSCNLRAIPIGTLFTLDLLRSHLVHE